MSIPKRKQRRHVPKGSLGLPSELVCDIQTLVVCGIPGFDQRMDAYRINRPLCLVDKSSHYITVDFSLTHLFVLYYPVILIFVCFRSGAAYFNGDP